MVTISIYKTIYITNDDGDVLEITICQDGFLGIKCPDGKTFDTMDGHELIKDLSING